MEVMEEAIGDNNKFKCIFRTARDQFASLRLENTGRYALDIDSRDGLNWITMPTLSIEMEMRIQY